MKSIKLRYRVGIDGILHLEIPVGIVDKDLEVMVIFQQLEAPLPAKTPEELGWPPGFFEEVIGGWVGEPIERAEQGEFETRDPLF
jgi:hypothetical protein